jgi:uncharacterized membrane protein YbhN (UPF0104 family)
VSDHKPTWKHRLWLALKLVIIAVVVAFVWQTLVDAWSQLDEYPWAFHAGWIAVAAVFYILALLPPALFWYCCLQALGQHPRFWEAVRAYYIGHLGKYVPGKALVVVIRAGLIRGDRVDTGVAAASVFLESLTWIAVGSFLAAGYLAATLSHACPAFWGVVALMAVTGVPTLPRVFPVLARLAGVGKRDPQIVEKLGQLGYKTTVLGWALMSVGWVFMGLAYWATFRAMGLPRIEGLAELPRYTAAVSLAVVAGFVAIFIPAGIGVREATLAKVMMPYLRGITAKAELAALGAAVLFRLVSVVSELGVSGILYGIGISRPEHPAEKPPPSPEA